MSDKQVKLTKDTINAILNHWTEGRNKEQFAHLVRHASRSVKRSLEYRLAKYDVSYGQWTFLRILWEEDGLSQRELSVRAGVMEPTTHAAIMKMERLGLVVRRVAEKSKRRQLVYLSSKAQSLKPELIQAAQNVDTLALEGVTDDEAAITRRVLLVMLENLARDETSFLDRGLKIAPLRARD